MFKEVVDGEECESRCGVCLLVVDPGDPSNRRVNVRLSINPGRFAKYGSHGSC